MYSSSSPDLTAMCMVRLDTTAQDASARILSFRSTTDSEMQLWYGLTDGKVRMELGGNGKYYEHTIGVGTWAHLAVTYDHDGNGAQPQVEYYVDGVSVKSQPFATQKDWTTLAGLGLMAQPNANFGGYRLVNGAIDSVKLFDTVLTPQEVAAEAAAALIPEPATLGLLGLAGAAFLMRRRRG